MYVKYFKRFFDFLISSFILIIFMPILLIIALIIYLIDEDRKVFYSQIRPGKLGIPFKIFKFKTMNNRKDNLGNLLPDEVRLTAIGKFIRSTSLDEIPQLWNVVKGDMSLIGPRPLLMEYLSLYNSTQLRRHELKPGITGWAQINGRNALSWEKKFELDIWYVDNISFKLDLKILFLTLKKVFIREGITSSSCVTMEPFKGEK